ncbi:MAG: MerR family transcriptional regulator [Herminiimonas sp.]|nr:MerR family transcriptional regulator [Herminiimonas sp.]MDB5854338.1 MerR family transcriptional regulator [Herminiimonas sp.]
MSQLTIGALATQTNTNVPTIRYYEEIGLLPRAHRAANGHRYYNNADLKRLTFIKRCRDLGFPIEQVRELVELFEQGDRSCVEVRDMAQVHLDAVRSRLEEMRQLEASLTAFVASCDEACCKGPTRDCAIIVDLSAVKPTLQAASSASCCEAPSTSSEQAKVAKLFKFSEARRTR